MRSLLLLLSSFVICGVACAQEQDVSMSVTTVEGHPMITISNAHALPIEAFLVTVDIAATHKPLSRIDYDVYTNYKSDVPIPSGTSKLVSLPYIVGHELPVPTLRAVVFSDGTSLGDGTWVQELLHLRRILSDQIEEVMALLQSASDQNLTREEVLDVLHKAWKARTDATPNASVHERARQNQVFFMAISNLERNPRANGKVPETSASLKHLSRALSLWLADLQAANPPLKRHPGP